jgi:hypothetical protein
VAKANGVLAGAKGQTQANGTGNLDADAVGTGTDREAAGVTGDAAPQGADVSMARESL